MLKIFRDSSHALKSGVKGLIWLIFFFSKIKKKKKKLISKGYLDLNKKLSFTILCLRQDECLITQISFDNPST